jgi:hypothetical protein
VRIAASLGRMALELGEGPAASRGIGRLVWLVAPAERGGLFAGI